MWSINMFKNLISNLVILYPYGSILFVSKVHKTVSDVLKTVNKPMFVKNKIVMTQNLRKKKRC